VVVAVAFKLGAVPFHMWVPDVYHGAPTAVTLFIATAPKIAGFALLMRLLVEGLGPLHGDWGDMLVVLAVLSLAVGNVIAIAQTSLKRMFAYSTIAHVGFLFMGILAGHRDRLRLGDVLHHRLRADRGWRLRDDHPAVESGPRGRSARRLQGAGAAQSLVRLHDAAAAVLDGRRAADGRILREAGGDPGGDRSRYVWLGVYAVIFSIIGAFYYLRVVKLMFFDEPTEERAVVDRGGMFATAISVNGSRCCCSGSSPACC
jgi:NADH-quinone oxidoreductase subunit N